MFSQQQGTRNLRNLNLNLTPTSSSHYHDHQTIMSSTPTATAQISWLLLPLRAALLFCIHLLFHLNLRCIIRPKPAPVSRSTTPVNSPLPARGGAHTHITHARPLNNNASAIFFTTNNSQLSPLSLQLALDFAAIGYHVFIQVSSHSQLTHLILRWQRLKSKLINQPNNTNSKSRGHTPATYSCRPAHPTLLPHIISALIHYIYYQLFSVPPTPHQKSNYTPPRIGTIIPLLYLTHHMNQRLDAISTISAYLAENHIDMITLINIVDPYQIRKSCPTLLSPVSPTFSLPRRSSHSASSSPSFVCRPLTGITSPSAVSEQPSNILHSPSTPRSVPTGSSGASQTHELYNPEPLPLSISSENYVFDAFGDVLLGPLSTIQDLLLVLKHHHARIINIWDGQRYAPHEGLNQILLEGFQKTSQVLKNELESLDIPLSTIFSPAHEPPHLPTPRTAHAILTGDPRSLLSDASDPELLAVFSKKTAELGAGDAATCTRASSSEPNMRAWFALVRSVVETHYPCPVYPIGVRDLAGQISQILGVGKTFSKLERLLGV